MRILVALLLSVLSLGAKAHDFNLLRKNLAIAPNNKKVCYTMLEALEQKENNNKEIGYLGAYTMIKANHQISPIQKLSSFRNGKKLLEKAIDAAPTDIELRYIRYAIQISIPSFLGYKDNLNEDKAFLQEKYRNASAPLQADIITLVKLKASKI